MYESSTALSELERSTESPMKSLSKTSYINIKYIYIKYIYINILYLASITLTNIPLDVATLTFETPTYHYYIFMFLPPVGCDLLSDKLI